MGRSRASQYAGEWHDRYWIVSTVTVWNGPHASLGCRIRSITVRCGLLFAVVIRELKWTVISFVGRVRRSVGSAQDLSPRAVWGVRLVPRSARSYRVTFVLHWQKSDSRRVACIVLDSI